VVPDVADSVHAHECRCLFARAAADAGDEQVGAGQALELGAGFVGDAGQLGARRDRRERAVDVEQERGLSRRFAEGGQQIHRTRIRA
jgi:hypothetical protein